MLIKEIDEMMPSLMKSGDKVRFNAIKSIKAALMAEQNNKERYNNIKKQLMQLHKNDEEEYIPTPSDFELTKEEEDKVLLKMVSSLEGGIAEFKKGLEGEKKDTILQLITDYENELAIVKEFAPKVVSDEEIAGLTKTVIDAYIKSMGVGYKISMRDTKPIMFEVQQTYPTANGKVISQIIKSMME